MQYIQYTSCNIRKVLEREICHLTFDLCIIIFYCSCYVINIDMFPHLLKASAEFECMHIWCC